MPNDTPKKVSSWDEEVVDVAPKKVDSWDEETTDEPVKKKVVTTPLESKNQDGAKVLSDVSEQSKQGAEPLSQPTEKKEPSKLPETYVSNRSNYKDLVEGQDYILNRGGKPITGKWDATKQEFVKNPLLDATPKEKTKGFVEGAVEMVAAGVPLKSYETETDVLARNAVEAENLKQEASQKALHANQIAKIPEINQLDELYKQLPSHPELQKQIDEISNTPITEKQFQGTRFISGSEGKVFQNIDTTIPTEDYNGKLMPMKNNEWLNDYKDAKTIGDVYNRVKEDVDYVQTVQAETNQFEDKLLKKRVSDLPEEEQNYLKQLEGSENYKDEALKILQNSNETKNVVDAGLLGVYDNVESIINTGNNRGLSDKQWNEKQANDFMYDNLFKKHPVTQAQQFTHSIGNMIPSLAAAPLSGGASLSLMAYPMMHEYEKEYYRDAIAQGKTPRKADAEQYAMASTATQMTMLLGAGAVGGKAMQLVGKSKLQRVGELLLEVGKRGAKDAVGFGLGGAYLQNKINKAFDVSENDDYARSALNMGLIGSTFGLVHGVGQAFKFKLPKKLVNEIDYHASYLPKELISSEISKLVNNGKLSTADALETDKKIDRFRQIRNQLNVDLSFEQMESIDKVWVEKQKLEESMKDASPEIKNIIKGQIEDLDRKAIIESLIPLSSSEKEELRNLTTKRATEGAVDEVRYKFLQDRKDAIENEKAKLAEEKKAEKEKEVKVGVGVVEDAEYNDFIDKGKVSEERLNDIANKVKNQEPLSDREKAIFSDKTGEINKIIATKAGSVGVGGDVDLGNNTIIVNMSLPLDSGVNTGLVKNSKGAVYHDKNTSKLEKLGYSKEQIDKLSQAELDEILAKNIENPNVETSAKMPLAEKQTTTQEFLNEANKEGGRFAELAKALKQFFGIDGVETEIVKGLKDFFGKNNDGDYANNKIRIDEKAKNKLQTFLHEAIHKVTVDKLLQFERGDYSKLSKQDIEAIQNLTRIFNESKVKINEFLGGGKGDRTKGHYGFTNVHEFISEAFTNPEFQSLLKNLPTEGNNPTIFKQFLDAVAKFLGLKDASILNDIFYYTENLNNKTAEQSLKETTKAEKETVAETVAEKGVEEPITEEIKTAIDNGEITREQVDGFIEQDESVITDIERKAESENEAELNEAIDQADKLIGEAVGATESKGKQSDKTAGQGEVKEEESGWTPIRMNEITDAKDEFRKKGISWTETNDSAMKKLANETSPNESLLDTAMRKIKSISQRLSDGELVTLNSEDIAVIRYARTKVNSDLAEISDNMFSDDSYKAKLANAQYLEKSNDLAEIDKALGGASSEMGRAFGTLQSEGKIDADQNLKIRRMEVKAKKGFLTTEDEGKIKDLVEREKKVAEAEQKINEESDQAEFEKKVQDEVRKRLGKPTQKKATTSTNRKQKAESLIAEGFDDIISALGVKLSATGDKRASLVTGFSKIGHGLIEKGVATIENVGQKIKEYLSSKDETKDIKYDEYHDEVVNGIKEVINQSNIDRLSELSINEKTSSITKKAVEEGVVSDLIDNYIKEGVKAKDVLAAALKDIQKKLPDVTEKQLRDAYLKKGDYELPTKQALESNVTKVKKELKVTEKLKSDIEVLEAGANLPSGERTEKAKSDYEKSLIDKKKSLLDERKELDNKLKEQIRKDKAEFERVEKLKEELERIKERKEKEVKESNPKKYTEKEQAVIDEIAKEQEKWDLEKKQAKKDKDDYEKLEALKAEFERIKERKEKERKEAKKKEPIQYNEEEKKVVDAINEEQKKWDAEKEQAKMDRKTAESLKKAEESNSKKEKELLDKISEAEHLFYQKINEKESVTKPITDKIKELKEILKQTKKETRDSERAIINESKKTDAIIDINAKINSVDNQLSLWKKIKSKTPSEIDTDLAKAKSELEKQMIKNGRRIERGSKESRTAKENVANSHNERIDEAVQSLTNKLNDGVSDKEEQAINNTIDLLNKSKIDTSTVEKLEDVSKRAINSLNKTQEAIKKQIDKAEGEHKSTLQEIEKTLKSLKSEYEKDDLKTTKDLQLKAYEKSLQTQMNKDVSDLAGGRFEDKPKLGSVNKTAKTVELEIEKRKIANEYMKMKQKALEEKKGNVEKAFDFLQKTRVASLIYNLSGLPKIIFSGVIKPSMETITRQGAGRLLKLAAPSLYESAGAEGTSLKQEYHRYKAMFGAMSETEMKAKVESDDAKLEEARVSVDEAKKAFEEDDSKANKKALEIAEGEHKEALLNATANVMYEWIGANSWKDAKNAFTKRVTQIDELMGYATPAEKFALQSKKEKYLTVIESMGAIHGMIKNFSARGEFAASFMARLENGASRGEDISNPENIILNLDKSYQDYLRGKYSNDNFITSMFKGISGQLEHGELHKEYQKQQYLLGKVLKFDAPIVKIPMNIVQEGVMEYTLGVPIAALNHATKGIEGFRVSRKDGATIKEGLENAQKQIKNLTPDEADFIIRCYRKGGTALGLAVAATLTGAIQFGGYYDPKHRKKEEGELPIGEVAIGGVRQPKWVSKIIMHTPFVTPTLLRLHYLRVKAMENKKEGHDPSDFNFEAFKSTVESVIDDIPMKDALSPYKQVTSSIPIPGIGVIKDIGEMYDMDKEGFLVKRKAETTLDKVKLMTGIDRKSVPAELSSTEFQSKKGKGELDINEKYQVGKTTYEYKDGAWKAIKK